MSGTDIASSCAMSGTVYAMSRTEIAYTFCNIPAMSGTDIAYMSRTVFLLLLTPPLCHARH
eukprot:3693202-Rhodomonas_salina.1